MEPAWDYDTLRAWFLARPGEDVVETDLLRAFFPNDDLFIAGADLELFQKHFLLYRRLWIFDDELRQTTGERLWIRSIRSTLLSPPPAGRCGHLDTDTGRYCLLPLMPDCELHRGQAPEVDSMKSYYLDWRNFEGMTTETLGLLMEGFFRWMGKAGAVRAALETLGLPEKTNHRAAKARWRQLSLEHHPDRGGDAQRFQELSAAWTVLKDYFLDEYFSPTTL